MPRKKYHKKGKWHDIPLLVCDECGFTDIKEAHMEAHIYQRHPVTILVEETVDSNILDSSAQPIEKKVIVAKFEE